MYPYPLHERRRRHVQTTRTPGLATGGAIGATSWRRAGADLRLLQKTMGHASITVTAHVYANLYDYELVDIASTLDALDDVR